MIKYFQFICLIVVQSISGLQMITLYNVLWLLWADYFFQTRMTIHQNVVTYGSVLSVKLNLKENLLFSSCKWIAVDIQDLERIRTPYLGRKLLSFSTTWFCFELLTSLKTHNILFYESSFKIDNLPNKTQNWWPDQQTDQTSVVNR